MYVVKLYIFQTNYKNNNTNCLLFIFLSRYDFRNRVAEVLEVNMSRVTILPGSPLTTVDGPCQKVSFLVSGTANNIVLYV